MVQTQSSRSTQIMLQTQGNKTLSLLPLRTSPLLCTATLTSSPCPPHEPHAHLQPLDDGPHDAALPSLSGCHTRLDLAQRQTALRRTQTVNRCTTSSTTSTQPQHRLSPLALSGQGYRMMTDRDPSSTVRLRPLSPVVPWTWPPAPSLPPHPPHGQAG